MPDGFFDVPEISYHKLNKFHEYEKFTQKFEAKKTTDDCYTPEPIYKAVHDWVFKRWSLPEDTKVLRPFYPGGDFEKEEYPEGCLVLDNPPFSLYAHIVRWYLSKGIRFFIFGPYLSGLVVGADVTYIVAGKQITYTNGAKVATCFCTNLPSDSRLICSTDRCIAHVLESGDTYCDTISLSKREQEIQRNLTNQANANRAAAKQGTDK